MNRRVFTQLSRRGALVSAACAVVAGTLAVGVFVQPATGSPTRPQARDAVQRGVDQLVRDDGFPAAMASVRAANGQVRNYTAGVAELKTHRAVPRDAQVRIGSNTKTFTATVVLQLVGEGKIDLDAPIEKYLPDLVRGENIDGRKISVRQLLQHTSGLPDYDAEYAADYLAVQHMYAEPHDVLGQAFKHPALFKPGTSWEYSNTNYIVAGLLVQKITGRPIGEEITNRIIKKLHLRHTYWPAQGVQSIRGRHAHGYFSDQPGKPLTDVTNQDPSFGWAAGQLISTPSEVNRFFAALLSGTLLKPQQLAEMKKTILAPDGSVRGDVRYGLGIQTFPLSCGGVAWGHGGDIPGFETRNAVRPDGRAATVVVTALPQTRPAAEHVEELVEKVLCR